MHIQHMEEAKVPLGILVLGIVCNIVGRIALAAS